MADTIELMITGGMALIFFWIIALILILLGLLIKKKIIMSAGLIILGAMAFATPILLFTRDGYIVTSNDQLILGLSSFLGGIVVAIGAQNLMRKKDNGPASR